MEAHTDRRHIQLGLLEMRQATAKETEMNNHEAPVEKEPRSDGTRRIDDKTGQALVYNPATRQFEQVVL